VPELDWQFTSEPLADGRRLLLPRGKLVGGTSMINGCIAVRGRPSDFASWEAAGATGWGWQDVLPYYEAVSEIVPIKRYPRELWLPIQEVVAEGFEELGFRWVEDLNADGAWDGVVGAEPQNRHNEIRQGTLVTYVRRARGRPNLTILDRALVDRVLFERRRARGVRYVDRLGRAQEAHAEMVVLCAGVYASSAILLRSGIGPADDARRLGITPLVELPVGRSLMDHPICFFWLKSSSALARLGSPGQAVAIRGTGWFTRPSPVYEDEGRSTLLYALESDHRDGCLRLATADPTAAPIIDHRYQDVLDRNDFADAWRSFLELLGTEALRGRGVLDGNHGRSFEEVARQGIASSTHAVGGCSIAEVVTPDLEVIGASRLFVADASVFPRNVSNNTNLTCMMVGEYASAKLRGKVAVRAPQPPGGRASLAGPKGS
jgi:choline dehydrogenase